MTKKDLFNAINNMDEKYIHDTQDVYKQPQTPEVIRLSENKQPYWKTILATAACTAAAMFAVFIPIVRSGAFGSLSPNDSQISESDSSGVVLSNNSSESSSTIGPEIKIDLDKETNYDVVLDSIFVYDKESAAFKRCEWGTEFHSGKLLMGGRSYFRNDNGDLKLYRQELNVTNYKHLELDCSNILTTEEGTEILLWESLSEVFGLPNFFADSPNDNDRVLHTDKFIGKTDSKTISIRSINITVNYDTNDITFSSDWVTAH